MSQFSLPELENESKYMTQLKALILSIESAFSKNNLSEVDNIISSHQIAVNHVGISIGILRSSFRARNHLRNWYELRNNTKKYIDTNGYASNVLMRGLLE